jgi:hypothetical protein
MATKTTPSDRLAMVGSFLALVGVLTVAGGIVRGLNGNRLGLDEALIGAVIVGVSSVPLAAAKDQQQKERRAYVKRWRLERGYF